MFNFNKLLPEDCTKERDFARGWSVASITAPIIEAQIREIWPNESDDFYNGILMGLRDEL